MDFDFLQPTEIDQACNLLKDYKEKAKIISGGTDFMIDLHKNDLSPEIEYIIDVSNLNELNYIKEDGDKIVIGAGTTHNEIANNPIINKWAPVLAKATNSIGSPQIRNRGTLAGNIVTASPAADSVPALLVLNATVKIKSFSTTREIPLEDFFINPYQSKINEDELIVEISFKKPPIKCKSGFKKLTRRKAVDKARLNIAILALQKNNGEVEMLRIAPGSVTPTPERFVDTENILINKKPTKELIKKAAEQVSSTMIEKSGYRWSTEYKKPVIQTMARRILTQVLEVE
ncbi:MAG: xanthine dehydrogenase family protein subunit M [Halanaerobiales bacterium]|nr:xanthine dehydrogenase family protein subunit M [Halanaerobiales bacterium]